MQTFSYVVFDEDNGAALIETHTDELLEHREAGEETPADDDDDEAWLLLARNYENGDRGAVMSIKDARNAARAVLEATQHTPEADCIASIWYVEDVQQQRPDLTKAQAMAVLLFVENAHDATIGINWDVIDEAAAHLFPQTEGA